MTTPPQSKSTERPVQQAERPSSHEEQNDDNREVIIRLEAINKSFRDFQALRDISVEIRSGVTGLLGPNGAGKSTLIKILLGLLKASSGQGSIMGLRVGVDNIEIRQRVGYMPEDDCYLPQLSGVESVQFAARLNRLPAIEALRRAHEILDFCGAGQERYRTVETYSTGMRQKLKFAQALVHDPPVLILDEPTSGLDPDEREAMLNRIKILASKHQKTILICTHILPDVQQVSDDVVILAAGQVSVASSLSALSKPLVPSLSLRVHGSTEAFADLLRAEAIEVADGPLGVLVVSGDGEQELQRVWQIAAEHDFAIRSLTPARNSMESIFLNAVQGAQHATP